MPEEVDQLVLEHRQTQNINSVWFAKLNGKVIRRLASKTKFCIMQESVKEILKKKYPKISIEI